MLNSAAGSRSPVHYMLFWKSFICKKDSYWVMDLPLLNMLNIRKCVVLPHGVVEGRVRSRTQPCTRTMNLIEISARTTDYQNW